MKFRETMRGATSLACASFALAAALLGPASAQSNIELEYWVFADFAQGEALKLQQTFISEFEAVNPGVKINISGKGDDDLTTGIVTGAVGGTLPDIYMNGTSVGAQLVEVGAMRNLYADWIAMPQEYRYQFSPAAIETCTPAPETMYCLPYTGFGTFMFRNLTVLEAAGIDPSTPIKDWADWLGQMEKVKAAGKFAVPDQTQTWQSIVSTYSGVAGSKDWGVDFEAKQTLVDPVKYEQVLKLFADMKPYSSGTSRNDQATKDLFINNELAFHIIGPWANPTYEDAAKSSGLKYDYVRYPGSKEGRFGGLKGFEMIGIAPKDNAEVAWKFAAYITEQRQMLRWAQLLSRYNANDAAMTDPSIDALPLIAMTKKAADTALDTFPPFFVGAYPSCYRPILTDNAAAVADGEMSPSEGAKALVAELNACLAE